jgi:dTDP-4-dehydrorhamnose reductase
MNIYQQIKTDMLENTNPNVNGLIEVWGGLECTINRVGDQYYDQLEYAGHYDRDNDLQELQSLGLKMLRYPVLWEKHRKRKDQVIDWSFAESRLNRIKEFNITPIVGLVHHGSGPCFVNFYDGSFEEGLAAYANEVAERFPWIEYYTPVNEPLTTARFCGLYGHWYPHKKTAYDFCRILVSECKATVMAMKEIRKINPHAKLIQTDDLGKTHSTRRLKYQADFENERRWASYDLLCGQLTPDKLMWKFMVKHGIPKSDLYYFLENNCPPDICGFNYYKTSERYLDENLGNYPKEFHGTNRKHRYADIHTAVLKMELNTGPYYLLKEAWERFRLPIAVTECHLYEPRDEQIRWFSAMWQTLLRLKSEGVPVKAITGWALYGLYGWNKLVTQPYGDYEPGIFNLSSGCPRPTALAGFIQNLIRDPGYNHPVLKQKGDADDNDPGRPIVIIGKSGMLGSAFGRICEKRNIRYLLLGHEDLDVADYRKACELLEELKPWAVINTAGYVNIDQAEHDLHACYRTNYVGAALLAEACERYNVKYLTFSSDMVFNGEKNQPYTESDPVDPINLYGESKASAENRVRSVNPDAIVIRCGSLFSPWDCRDFVSRILGALKESKAMHVANDVFVSPTYVPDLIIECLNLLFDGEAGIFHIANEGTISWSSFAAKIAGIAGYRRNNINALSILKMHREAQRPKFTALQSEKGIRLPSLDDALHRYFEEKEENMAIDRIAVRPGTANRNNLQTFRERYKTGLQNLLSYLAGLKKDVARDTV